MRANLALDARILALALGFASATFASCLRQRHVHFLQVVWPSLARQFGMVVPVLAEARDFDHARGQGRFG